MRASTTAVSWKIIVIPDVNENRNRRKPDANALQDNIVVQQCQEKTEIPIV